MPKTTYAIVGANLAGGRAALALRDEGFDGNIVLIGTEPHPPYERPPLSKELLAGVRSVESTYLHPIDHYADQNIELRLGTTVSRLLPRWSGVEFADGSTLIADRILLTTGSRLRRLPVAGAGLEGVHYLRTLDDALAIRERLHEQPRITIIGAGFIGAEFASSAISAGCSVTMLEAAEVPLGRALGHDIGQFYAAVHRSCGVDLRTGTAVAEIRGEHGHVRKVIAVDGTAFDTDLVVIGVGTIAASELADDAGIETDHGIVVDAYCRTSAPNVFAAGEVARHPNPWLASRVRLEHFQTAQNQALTAARSMLGRTARYEEVPWFWSDQYHLNLQLAGHPKASDTRLLRGDMSDSSFSVIYLRDGRISCIVAVNRPRDVRAAMKLIEQGRVVNPAELTDETIDLRRLAASAGR
ncbi:MULTISPECIES: NAD(P)/FAD-dependent oxidoreductase [Mycobacterium]|uniref:NAD(P)/FAD-dependent oxidoreductase n=1 Tax=Mycobacterium TaxID=1763 RepID=UPI00200C54BC|nr:MULTISPECIES: FAD-dependent oxidoreductase [Mycobacterium]UQB93099.1 FAD-dependent oxidoreductase [Mycobacterium intracellulare]WSE46184.1 FAD-dependent oxidoreductase [Mycobacterium sp. 3-98]